MEPRHRSWRPGTSSSIQQHRLHHTLLMKTTSRPIVLLARTRRFTGPSRSCHADAAVAERSDRDQSASQRSVAHVRDAVDAGDEGRARIWAAAQASAASCRPDRDERFPRKHASARSGQGGDALHVHSRVLSVGCERPAGAGKRASATTAADDRLPFADACGWWRRAGSLVEERS